ncbi:MAG TPA: phosphoglycolate phosphatase [Xanthobacteraceae bacterium]|nr:phosphoglycolate phosphatase [Xanthobacteraceae bacterium]
MLTIVFDLDGTLIDTAPDLIDTLNLVLAREGLPRMPFEAARRLIGGGARALIERALAAEGRPATKPDMDRLFAGFIEHYSAHIADRSRPYPHVETTLDRLAAQGHRLAVCTNKLERLSRRLLTALNLTERFATVCGQDTFGVMKPDPDAFRQTVRRAGGEPTTAVMVGDSGTDVRTARAANVPVIGVDFGYTDVPIATLQPDRIISSYGELPEAIAAVTASRAD